MSRLLDKLLDQDWVPRYGEVTIKYQDGVPVLITRTISEKLDPEPSTAHLRKLPERKNEHQSNCKR